MLPVVYTPMAEKYFKKLKDKQLKNTFKEAIISVGKYNIYNHPSTETLEKLREKNIKTYITSDKQTIRKKML